MITIYVDLEGTDNSSVNFIHPIIDFVNQIPDLKVVLCGVEENIKKGLEGLLFNKNQVQAIFCDEIIMNSDIPTRAFKTKPNSSMIEGLNLAKNDEYSGFVSCGSTGACLVSSILLLGKVEGVRPALACLLPTINNDQVCIVDCGANIDMSAEQIFSFSKLGIAYEQAIGKENPRVALLSNGSEEKKGNEITKQVHCLLKESNQNFIGNIEGNSVLSGITDVVVCDGFAGNILIKSIEGAAKSVIKDIYSFHNGTDDVIQKITKKILDKYDYNNKGGAVLLGVKKPVIKGHGAATGETFQSIIKMCYDLVKGNLVDKITHLIENN